MKIAFILLCHKNPKQINRLLMQLLSFDCDIFIHIDRKSEKVKKELLKKDNIHLLAYEESYDIKWGGMDMILATLSLLKHVVSYSNDNNTKFDYVWLLSGQDYMIQRKDVVIKRLIDNNDNNYINIVPLDSKEYNKYLKLYEVAYPSWITKDNVIIKIIKRIYMILTGGYKNTFSCFKRRKPFSGSFYFGSQWWTITSECIDYILDYCDNNPEYIEYFRKSIIPDECFFQTIVMNSEYKDSVVNNLTYVNWGNNRRSPEVIKKEDYNRVISKNEMFFFARKFDIDVDKSVLDLIDKTLL